MASLFQECIEIVSATPLSVKEDLQLGDLFEKCFPITEWGKIDWDKIEHKIEIGYDPKNILPSLEQLFGKKVDTAVYILWSSATQPMIQTDLKKVVEFFDYIISISPDKFIFNLELGYVLEILASDQMTIGVVPACAKKI